MARRTWSRTFLFGLFAALFAAVLYLQAGQPPFVAVASGSMEPVLHRGDLVTVAPVDPAQVQVGDIVVVRVPGSAQDKYGYPGSIVHRVVEVQAGSAVPSFRIKGDSVAAEDPFLVRAGDVAGRVSATYGKAGYPILYLQSPQGLLFVAVSAGIYTLYTFSASLARRGVRMRDAVAKHVQAPTLFRLDQIERAQADAMHQVSQSMVGFSEAVREYATHLKSHTAAVQQMAQAAQEIRGSVELQQQALMAALGRTGAPSPAPLPESVALRSRDEPPQVEAPRLESPPQTADPGTAFVAAALETLERKDRPAPDAADTAAPRVFRYKTAAAQAPSTPAPASEDAAYRILEWGA